MNSCRALRVGPFVLLIAIAGCGGGGGFNPNNVTVTVSPAAATVPANGQVTLKATVNGLCSTCAPQIDDWSITENGGTFCTWFTTPPIGPSPAGTIQETAGSLLTVTYYAPSTSGKFHVSASWSLIFTTPTVTKVGGSVITVP
jgi:hypothetical protein